MHDAVTTGGDNAEENDLRLIHGIAVSLSMAGGMMITRCMVPRSGEVEAVEVHHLDPGRDKVLHKFRPGIGTSIDFSEGTEA